MARLVDGKIIIYDVKKDKYREITLEDGDFLERCICSEMIFEKNEKRKKLKEEFDDFIKKLENHLEKENAK